MKVMKKILLLTFLFCSCFLAKAQYIILLSPNGGETLAIGSYQTITWASIGINELNIEYSSNNGASFTLVASNVSVFTNSYSWQVSGPATSNGLIRLKESSTGVITDVSAATFTVVNPSIQITYPTTGLIFNPLQQINITWSGLIVSNNVTLFFSDDNGANYDTIVANTPNFYNYDWIIPSVSSTTCKIKIIDAGSPTVQNISATFTIEALPSSGTILTPNGGENLFSTSNYNITWNVIGTNIVDLDYSTDGGANWLSIVQNLPASPGTYNWVVPSANSSNAKVRLKNAINGNVLDQSNNVFNIIQPTPTLYLSSPFGYENWAAGSTQSIQWLYTYISSVKIEYSTNGGSSFTLISANIAASDLSYNWVVPAGVSANCIIRITDNNSSTSSQNQNPFSIVNPSVTVQTPNGGEVFNSNVDTLITWNGNFVSNLVKIEYSTNNGTAWNLVANNIPNTNYYQWLVPNTPSTNCKVRVSDAQFPAVIDQSNNTFTITAPIPTINLISPTGAEQWGIGTYQTIFWNSNNIANIKIQCSVDSGVNWTIVNPLVPANLGTYTWLVNLNNTNNALIKVSDASNSSVNDISDSVFEIYTPTAFIDLIYPNGGEQLASSINADITWNSQSINQVIIEYSVNNGMSWIPIASGIQASLGVYHWNVPNLYGNAFKIRIRDENDISLFDQTAGLFSIIDPSLNFVSFPDGSTYSLFSNITILWSSIGLNNQLLRLEYSINNGINWVTFASGVQNTGSYNWLINCPSNSICKIRVSVENEPSVNTVTPVGINVISAGPSIVVLSPYPSETLVAGNVYPITWSSYGINYVRIEYSLNGDTIFQLITPFTNAASGVFNWNVPANLNAVNCKIKISNAANTSLSAQTPFTFAIQTGHFDMQSGFTADILIAGDIYEIVWYNYSTSNYVNLHYSLDSLNWNSIAANVINTGNYFWTIPYINADSVWYRVQDNANLNIFALNAEPQKIIIADSTLNLISPADGTLILSGSNYMITWDAAGLTAVDIDYSDDNGATWNGIATNIDASVETYLWSIPTIASNTALIRIKNSNFSTQFTQNQLPFTISNVFLNVTSPNGGESFNSNSNHYITWQSLGIDFVNLYYSTDAGVSYNVIDTNVYNLGYYNWLTPIVGGSNFRIKIMESNPPYFSDESNANFTISTITPSITLLSPNGGEQLNSNTAQYITWQGSGINNIDLSYSLDGGSNYISIANNVPAIPAYYFWLIPDTFSLSCKVKITESGNSALNDASNSNFAILKDSLQLTINYPNGGEIFNSMSYQTIKWTSNVPFVKLYYSINGGLSYNYISAVLNDSMFIWQVPAIASTNCKIKIENGNDVSLNDVSNSIFSINNQLPSTNLIQIDSLPNTSYCTGAALSIPFSITGSFNSSNNFRVHLSNPFGSFSSFTDIGGIVSNTNGIIQCYIPPQILTSSTYTIRIVSDNPVATSLNYTFGNISINKANSDFISDKQLVLFPNTTVSFEANASSSATLSSSWITGNGGNYTSFAAQHTYSTAGKYDVIHTVTSNSNCTSVSNYPKYINVEHWFPNTILNSNSNQEIIDIEFENEQYGFAIFRNGNCLVTSDSGKTWVLSYTVPNNILLNSISILNNDWFISTDNGSYLKSTNKGLTWTQYLTNNSESLRDLLFIATNKAYAVGNNGKLLQFNGSVWQNQNTGLGSRLNKIASSYNTNVVVGDNAVVLKLQNNSWSSISSPVNVNLNSVHFKDSLTGFIVGDFGFILKTIDAGNTWNVVLSGADVNFSSVYCFADSIWALANGGIIYTSKNNGLSWNRFNIGVKDDLNSITYVKNKGYIVGKNGLLRTFNQPNFVQIVDYLNDKKDELIVNCFPNPTSDIVNLSFNKSLSSININITDIQGKLVFNKTINNIISNGQTQLDLSKLQNGIYLISVVTDGRYQTFKIIKAK